VCQQAFLNRLVSDHANACKQPTSTEAAELDSAEQLSASSAAHHTSGSDHLISNPAVPILAALSPTTVDSDTESLSLLHHPAIAPSIVSAVPAHGTGLDPLLRSGGTALDAAVLTEVITSEGSSGVDCPGEINSFKFVLIYKEVSLLSRNDC